MSGDGTGGKPCTKDVTEYCKSCPECQFRDAKRMEEPSKMTFLNQLFYRINSDVTYMPKAQGKRYLIVARDDFSSWPEARALERLTPEGVAKFFYEEVIARHGLPREVRLDNGPENKGEMERLLQQFGVRTIKITAYNSKGAGNIESGHRVFHNAIAKVTQGTGRKWPDLLPAVLLSDRVTTKRSTGMSPFRMLYGFEAILPIETEIPAWSSIDPTGVTTTEELLRYRAEQIDRRDSISKKRRRDWREPESRMLNISIITTWCGPNSSKPEIWCLGTTLGS